VEWIFWAILGAALIHVGEEYLGGWVDWVQSFAPVTVTQFVIVNAAFVLLCIAGSIVGARSLLFSLSVASLIFINALLHLVMTVITKRYSPGVVSAALLYIPLALLAYYLSANSGQLTLFEGVGSGLLGLLWMALPVGFQLLRRQT